MYKNVFFSFHYDDVWMVNQIRNSNLIQGTAKSGFKDKAEFEKIKRTGDTAVKNWIDKQLHGTTVTCVLIGKETLNRPYVQYEIQQSRNKGNVILGITLDGMKDIDGCVCKSVCNTDTIVGYTIDTQEPVKFSEVAKKIYSYKDDGYEKLGSWIKQATTMHCLKLEKTQENFKIPKL